MIRTAFDIDNQFSPPFESIIPRTDGTFEYLITRSLSLSFSNLTMISEDKSIYTSLLEVILSLDILEVTKKIMLARIANIEEFEVERINRHFSGHRKPIFFDKEECSRLMDLFARVRFLADADIMRDGEVVDFIKLSSSDQYRITATMMDLGLVNEQGPSDYKASANIVRVKQLVKRSKYRSGGKTMNKRDLILKVAVGALTLAGGAVLSMIGGISLKKSLSVLLGASKEVILIEDDLSEEAEE